VVLITNTDDDIIKETEKTIGVKFDEIVTAQQAGAYKPSHKGFHLARAAEPAEVRDLACWLWFQVRYCTGH